MIQRFDLGLDRWLRERIHVKRGVLQVHALSAILMMPLCTDTSGLLIDWTPYERVQAGPSADVQFSMAAPAGIPAWRVTIDADSDGDGLSDLMEIHKYRTDPKKRDSDGDRISDEDWNERREYTYSIRVIFRFLPPVHEAAMNDGLQDTRILNKTDEYVEAEIILYPLSTFDQSVGADPNWQQDYAPMTQYLSPGITTNWDDRMRQELLARLKADAIGIDTLTDREVVEKVCRWLLDRSRSLDKVFTTMYIHYPGGRPAVYPGLEDAFRREFERDRASYKWTLEQHPDHELLGKGMFYNKTHGSCTSTAVYLTTVLRALGIPSRMILVTPLVDGSDEEQCSLLGRGLTHQQLRKRVLSKLSDGFTNHTLNEVFVGGRWCGLDYGHWVDGDHRPFALCIHLYTFNDLSEVDLAPTWGVRYAKGLRTDVFRHSNPYAAVEVSDLFGPHSNVPNPQAPRYVRNPDGRPNLFIFEPGAPEASKFRAWSTILPLVQKTTANKTGRPHEKHHYEALFNGMNNRQENDILVMVFSLDTDGRIPSEFEDLLPRPWSQIEASLKQGQTVVLEGQARDLRTVVLAAPRHEQIEPLIRQSQILEGLAKKSGQPDPCTPAVPKSLGR